MVNGGLYGAMPLTILLYPEDARAPLKMLKPRAIWFLITILFKSALKPRP